MTYPVVHSPKSGVETNQVVQPPNSGVEPNLVVQPPNSEMEPTATSLSFEKEEDKNR